MDVDTLLTKLGAVDRALHQQEQAPRAADARSAECWPPWRILLCRHSDPVALEAWLEGHSEACPQCRAAYERVLRDDETRDCVGPKPNLQVFHAFIDESWHCALPYAAHTPPRLDSPDVELPMVQYHQVRDVSESTLDAVWCATWDNTVYVLLVGSAPALGRWSAGADLVSRQGCRVGCLKQANAEMHNLLAPEGTFGESEVLCLQCQVTLAELGGSTFTVPKLLSGEVRFAPAEAEPSRVQQLVTDLTSRNRTGRFLAGLPEHCDAPAHALTLNFYLRLLHAQGRLTAEDRTRLLTFHWLADELRRVFTNSDETDSE